MGKAAEIAREWFANGGPEKMATLRDHLERVLVAKIERVRVNSGSAPRTPNTSNIAFDCIEGEAMVIALDLKGIAVSSGAACSSGALEPSHVLMAMGMSADQARASVRFSLGKQTTQDDIDLAVARVPEVVERLRELSPLWKAQAVGTK